MSVVVLTAASAVMLAAGGTCGVAMGQGAGNVRWEGLSVHGQSIAALGDLERVDQSPAIIGSLNLPQVGHDGTVVYQSLFQPTAASQFEETATLYRRAGGSDVLLKRSDRPLQVAGVGQVTWLSGGRPLGTMVEPATTYLRIAGEGITSANDDLLGRLTAGGVVTPLVRQGDVAPGAGDGVVFGELATPFTSEPFYVNSSGDVAMWARLAGTGVTTANSQSVWLVRDGAAPVLVLRQGESGGSTAGLIDLIDAPAVNDRGEVAVRARIRRSDQSTLTNVWIKRPGEATRLRFVSGSMVEGSGLGEVYTLISSGVSVAGSSFNIGDVLQLNSQGRFAMWGDVRPAAGGLPARAMLSNFDDGGLRVIMRQGEQVAPGFVLSLSTLDRAPLLSDTGHVVTITGVRPPQGSSVRGIVAHHPQAGLRLVARAGQAAEGLPAGQTIDGDFRGIAVNAFGDVMFRSRIAGPGVGAFNQAWWLATIDGRLILLASGGSESTVTLTDGTTFAGELRAIDLFENESTLAGTKQTLSDRGEVAGALHFANDTTAIVHGVVRLCRADMGGEGAEITSDGVLDNNDFVVFVQSFFAEHPRADLGGEGAERVADGVFDNNDFVVFVQQFFEGCE